MSEFDRNNNVPHRRILPRNIWANVLNVPYNRIENSTDYSEEWIVALESFAYVENKFEDVEYHCALIQVLSEFEDRVQCPSVLPPERSPSTRMRRANNGRRTTQVRYLLLMAQTGKCEALRCGAKDYLNRKLYRLSADLWVQAYEVVNIPLLTASLWNVLRLRADQTHTTAIGEGHHYQTLCGLIQNVSLVCEDTVKHRHRTLEKMKNALKNVEEKLNPIELSRSEIMKRMGDRWYNNPNPKLDHAHKMLLLRQEKQELVESIEVIELLCFAATL